MGCEVVSVYNDQIIGKIGYPSAIVDDLLDRDYKQLNFIDGQNLNLNQKIKNIYGFNQSFATSRIFFTMVNNVQIVVYVAGRFIVLREVSSNKQKVITNKDYIASFMVIDKYCLVGLIGGIVILWDLQFIQIKLEVLLPQRSTTISTVGLTNKYIFVTDSSQPNNFAYCYDLRTAQLLAYSSIPSFEPAVRCITIGQDLHITACADGLWFIKMLKAEKVLQVVRGMFGHCPKTSMTCLEKIDEYIVSGGVDGYVYVWKISTMKCCRALKVGDSQITAIAVKGKNLIFGCGDGRVKSYSFDVTKRQKKQYEIDNLSKQAQDDDDLVIAFIVVDSYVRQGEIMAIAPSVVHPLLYYCQTRRGLFFQNYLPAPTAERRKLNINLNLNETIERINLSGKMMIDGGKLYSCYRGGKSLILVDIYVIKENGLNLEEERMMGIRQDCQNLVGYSIGSQQIAYITLTNQLWVSLTYNKVEEVMANEKRSDFNTNTKLLQKIGNEKVISLNYLKTDKQYLFLTTQSSIFIYQRVSRLIYEQKQHLKYQKTIPSIIKLQGKQFCYDEVGNHWKNKQSHCQPLSPQRKNQLQVIHTSKLLSIDQSWGKMSCGGGFVILWK